MKGGIGTASMKSEHGATVGALVVVNAFGDVIDPSSGKILAGARVSEKSKRLADSSKRIMEGTIRRRFGFLNTTLGIIATDVQLCREDLKKVIRLAHSGLAKTISPLHTTFDGDIIFALSLGKKEADVNTVGILAEVALMMDLGPSRPLRIFQDNGGMRRARGTHQQDGSRYPQCKKDHCPYRGWDFGGKWNPRF
jgi:L-aminopeptidase/D-esterase-like protein